jgi:hypothetical protein
MDQFACAAIKSTKPSDDYLLIVLRYVERNPVRAGLVSRAEDWLWSSASSDGGGADRLRPGGPADGLVGLGQPGGDRRGGGAAADICGSGSAVPCRRMGGNDGGPVGVRGELATARPAAEGGGARSFPVQLADDELKPRAVLPLVRRG